MTSSAPAAEPNRKYDRQLRIWGVEGQSRLMRANVCLLNAGPTGTETLKNLVLPGIGSFTVVDSCVVTEHDLENNFFVSSKHLGRPRAECCAELLGELNQDVRPTAHVRDPVDLVERDPGFFLRFSLIIATQLPEHTLVVLGDLCDRLAVPLVVARTYGLVAQVRVFAKEHFCYNVNPYPTPDLRMYRPFPALAELSRTEPFNQHVPYVLVLSNEIAKWKKAHNDKLPASPVERQEFKQQVLSLSAKGEMLEENLQEALKVLYLAHTKPALRQELRDLFADNKARDLDLNSPKEWILTHALREFYFSGGGEAADGEVEEELPLTGLLPDMSSTTQLFVKVQQCFNKKSRADFERFSQLVDAALAKAGQSASSSSSSALSTTIPHDDRMLFFKHSASQMCVRHRTLRDEYESPLQDQLPWCGDAGELSPFVWYLAWRACDEHFYRTRTYPGTSSADLEAEATALHARLLELARRHYPGFDQEQLLLTLNVCREMVRYGAVEVHNVAAVAGGIAAQEAVKLITHQYEPLNHTYFYNGITAEGGNWQL